jgi:hypothetical protein
MIPGRSSLNPRTASAIAATTTSRSPPMAITMATTSTTDERRRLQRSRRSIAVTTGESTATLKVDTKRTRRTLAMDVSAHATATTPATRRIVLTDSETSSSVRGVCLVREEFGVAI